jgi:ABC-type transport system substrate-binding protein
MNDRRPAAAPAPIIAAWHGRRPAAVPAPIIAALRPPAPRSRLPSRGAALAACLLAFGAIAQSCMAAAADPNKILRLASFDIETFDPQQFTDNPSFQVFAAIFEGLYEYDYLASPPKLSPVTALGAPTITDDGKTWTIRLAPGIFFTDDPAFGGKPRELVAADYVYSLKRWLDPNLRRGGAPLVADLLVGARAAVDAASQPGAKFDYDRPIEGLRALDRHTLQLRLTEPNYPVIHDNLNRGAVAREVVEAAGGDIRARPVGTGPYRLREWKRGSRIVLEANPGYRALRFPESSNPAHAALVRSMQGRTLPQVGVIEISIIEEDTSLLLEFERGGLDYIVVRGEPATRLLANGKLKPEVAARGVTRHAFYEPFLFSIVFNLKDPVVGGMDNDHIALRRAIALAIDLSTLVKVVYAGQAAPANQIVPPGVGGHDPALPTKPIYDPAAAKALLDRFGYGKLDAQGFRKAPDGKPLSLTFTLRSGAVSREIQTLVKRNMDAVGLRMEFHVTPFQDAIKELIAGKYQLFFSGFGGSASGYAQLSQLWSKSQPSINHSRFSLPEYDAAFAQFLQSPEPAAQVAAARRMSDIARAYVPILPAVFRLESNYVQPWVQGFSPPVFQTYWKYLDIDLARRRQAKGK